MKNQEGNLLVGQEDIAHQWTQYFSTFFNVPENMPTEEDRAEEDVPADKEEYPITLDKAKCALDWYQNHRPWMTLNCCTFKFSRNFALVGMFGRQQRLNE